MSKYSVLQADWATDQDQLIAVRRSVFIEEQKVAEELEIDGQDIISQHVKAVAPGGLVIATARLLPSNYIGRMCVLKNYRNQGIGGKMLAFFINYASQHNIESLHLNAQLTALGFYQKYGFIINSEVFIEADIEHVHMTLTLAHSIN